MSTTGKRYTYYRAPDGRPYHGTDEKWAPTHILSEIGKTAFLNAEGKVSWHGLDVKTRFQVALRSAFAILSPDGVELNETDTWRLVREGLLALIKNKPGHEVNPVKLVGAIDDLAAAFFRTPLNRYVLVSSLSIAELPASRIVMKDCEIAPLKKRGAKFRLPKVLSTLPNTSVFFNHIERTQYKPVRVSVTGRSIHDATDRALNSLNLLRALWSLPATCGSWRIYCRGPTREPLGVIHLGPIHTLHFPDGEPASSDLYWYEPDYTGDQRLFQGAKQWSQIERSRQWAARRLRTLQYRSDLEALLIRYVRALDQLNMDVAFLQMWSILEKMTGTIGARYDETIERTIWVLPKGAQPSARDILESLRCRRNQYVHSGKVSDEGDQAAYLIKSFVDPHLIHLLSNALGVHSLDEYAKFLSLPTDLDTLSEDRQRLVRAIRMLHP